MGPVIMINAYGEIISDQTSVCSKEDALLLLLNIKLSQDAISAGMCLDDILDNEKESAEFRYSNAKAEKLSDEAIKAAFDNLINADRFITKAAQYRRDITDELAKKDSALRRNESGQITIISLNLWAHKKYKLRLENMEDSEHEAQDKPLLIVDPRDPSALVSWYTPARYFARQHVINDPNLIHNRNKLAEKTVESLEAVGIYKRGNKKPLDPSTILKALSNITLG